MLLVLTSCSGTLYHEYTGEPRPDYEVAILANVEYLGHSAIVTAIDGKPVTGEHGRTYHRDSVAILPGPHDIEAKLCGMGFIGPGFSCGVGPFCIRFEAEAGKRYELDGLWASSLWAMLRDDPWYMWIEDSDTGEIVAESEKTWAGSWEIESVPCS